MDLQIRQAQPADLSQVQGWLEADTGPSNLVGHYAPSEGALNLRDPDNGWVATLDGELVAFASLQPGFGHQASLGFAVKPDRRREGIAKTFIPLLLQTADLSAYSGVASTLAEEDTAVRKILERNGFHQIGNDEAGQLVFVRR